jgi:pimeloyl-ACP methyl ester carboxylesterase
VTPDIVPSTVTLYVHGLGFGEWFWRNPVHDFASSMAALGHASVIIDRIGYDSSDHPIGYLSCLGAQADVAHQIIGQLKNGISAGNTTVAFSSVALVGHSAGGAIAQLEAYSLGDIGALGVLSYADQGASNLALGAFGGVALSCVTGGQPAEPGAPGGYAPFGGTNDEFDALMFSNPLAGARDLAHAIRNPDPCGDDASIPGEIVASNLLLSTVAIPVLVLCADDDAIFPFDTSCSSQQSHFSGSPNVAFEHVSGGHALTLESSAVTFESKLSGWLSAHGF